MNNIPYTYLIGWSKHQKYYYGVRYSKDCSPEDLWNGYYTSSKYVKDFREENGEPDIIEVRKIFETRDEARTWEHNVLKKMNVSKKKEWLNQSDNSSVVLTSEMLKKRWKDGVYANRKQPDDINERTGRALREKWKKEKHHSIGSTLTETHKHNISKGVRNSEKYKSAKENDLFARRGKDNGMYGKTHSTDTKMKMSELAKNRKKYPCIHCGEIYPPSLLSRWHNDNCKLKEKFLNNRGAE